MSTLWLAMMLLAASNVSAQAQAQAHAHAEPAPCLVAAEMAEQRHRIPPGLLAAIGRFESGRRDSQTGSLVPWPFTINAAGRGTFFESGSDTIAAIRNLQAAGTGSVDVGCFQINLRHHPAAFPTLEAAIDPAANADYAARFLNQLYGRLGAWDEAVGAYHSSTPERSLWYRRRVLGEGAAIQRQPDPLPPLTLQTITWSPTPARTGMPGMVIGPLRGLPMQVWSPSPRGAAPAVIRIRP